MKNKILLISLAVVLAASLGVAAIGCGGGACTYPTDKIAFYASRSLSGPLESVGDYAFGPIIDYWQDGVNRAGGIAAGGGSKLPVEVTIVDDLSDIGRMSGYLAAAIASCNYNFVLSPCSTSFLQSAAGTCSGSQFVLLGGEGGCTTIQNQLNSAQYKYLFATLSFSTWDQMTELFKILRDWQTNDGMANPADVAIMYIGDLHGTEYLDAFAAEAAEPANAGHFNLVYNYSVPIDAVSVLTPLTQAANTYNADLLCSFTYPPASMLTVSESISNNFSFPAMIVGPGVNFEFMLLPVVSGVNCNLDLQGVMGFTTFNEETLTAIGGDAATFVQNLTAFFGQPLGTKVYGTTREIINCETGGTPPLGRFILDWWGAMPYYAGLEMLQEAIETVGVDNNAVRNEFATRTATTPFTTTFGDAWFVDPTDGSAPGTDSGGLMCLDFYHGQIGQWQYVSTAHPYGAPSYSAIWPSMNTTYCLGNYDGWMIYEIIDVGTGTADGVFPMPGWHTQGGYSP